MMNEVMAVAVTGIDEKLISDAEKIQKKSNIIRPLFSVCAVAACLVLIFTFIFTAGNRFSTTQLLMNGSEITQSPMTIDIPLTAQARDVNRNFTVHLTLDIEETTRISISDGEMSVVSKGNTDTLYHKGTEYTTDIPVNIHWTVDGSDINSAYTLTLNNGDVVYALTYDEASSLWSISKQ